jgi:hypothetical protein
MTRFSFDPAVDLNRRGPRRARAYQAVYFVPFVRRRGWHAAFNSSKPGWNTP